MPLVDRFRAVYRRSIHLPALDRTIYAVLDTLTNLYSSWRGYSFPQNYIRRWKLNILWDLYEPETVALFQRVIKPGMIVVDIGAHIGYFTRLFSKLAGPEGQVCAFEADPENYALLRKNTRRLRNVKIFPLAITDQIDTIDFYHYPDKAGCHSTLPNVPLDFRKEKITVASSDLDSLLRQEKIERVDLIKMDIEGGESAALRGMAQTLARSNNLIMITEFAPAWIKASGVEPLNFLKELESLGFKIFAIQPTLLLPLDPRRAESYLSILPKTPTAFNEFINLYCSRNPPHSLM